MSCVDNLTVLSRSVLSWVTHNKPAKKRVIINTLFLGGVILLSQGLYMDAKAIVAQELIKHSWQQRAAGSPPSTPWWWADTKTIATLNVHRLNKKVFVMNDDSGESLAFGPGHLRASAGVSQPGHVMIAGHRDSHFDFLQHLVVGDLIETVDYDSNVARYRIKKITILNTDTDDLIKLDENKLTLITCYPFNDFIPGGPLRYIVDADRIKVDDIQRDTLAETPLK